MTTAAVGRKTARGLLWAFAGATAHRLAWLAGLIFLARLISPADFGVFAFALLFITFVESIGDLGTRAALIYWPERSDEVARVTFRTNLVMGLVWFGAAQLAAPAVATFFDSPAAEAVLRVLAFSFLIKALGNTHDALCQRELRFAARLIPELALAAGKTATAVILALGGYGVWSLVAGQLAGLLLWCLLLWIVVPWRPAGRIPRGLGARVLRYGAGIVAVNVLAAGLHRLHLVIVGYSFGATTLGFYHLAAKIPEASVAVAIWVTGSVLFPAFSRLNAAGAQLRDPYLLALRYIALLALPMAAGLVVLAPTLIPVMFGPDWGPAIPLLQALAVYLGLRALGTHAGDVMKATGRTGLLTRLALVKLALLAPALMIAARYGAETVAWTLAGVTGLTAAMSLVVVARLIQLPAAGFAQALRPGILATGFMLAVLGLGEWLAPATATLAWLTAQIALGAAAFFVAVRYIDPQVFSRAVRLLRADRLPARPMVEAPR